MTAAVSIPEASWRASRAWALVLPVAGVHLAMLVYDVAHPDRFLRADRADERLHAIMGLPGAWAKGEAASYIASHGIVGDWLPQGLLYLAGGQYAVIALQVALALASIVWLRDIALRVGLDDRQASAAATLYALLPHTLVFPHQLAAEALFLPLVIYAFRASGVASGLALGVATLVRPLTLLWPFVHAAVARRGRWRRRLLLAAFAPLVAWMAFLWTQTGEVTMGRSDHDLGSNLYERMQRMAASLPDAERPAARSGDATRASLGDYARFVAAHPGAAARHTVRDLATLFGKSGLERLTLDYLDLFPDARARLQDSSDGWRARAERVGLARELAQLFRAEPWLIATSTVGALLFIAFIAAAARGAWRWLHERRLVRREVAVRRFLLAAFVLYVFATAQCVDAAQSRHRAPAEFALCLLAVAGWLTRKRSFTEGLHGR
jgi:hypothetical protein